MLREILFSDIDYEVSQVKLLECEFHLSGVYAKRASAENKK
jgi:hypothetical protein